MQPMDEDEEKKGFARYLCEESHRLQRELRCPVCHRSTSDIGIYEEQDLLRKQKSIIAPTVCSEGCGNPTAIYQEDFKLACEKCGAMASHFEEDRVYE